MRTSALLPIGAYVPPLFDLLAVERRVRIGVATPADALPARALGNVARADAIDCENLLAAGISAREKLGVAHDLVLENKVLEARANFFAAKFENVRLHNLLRTALAHAADDLAAALDGAQNVLLPAVEAIAVAADKLVAARSIAAADFTFDVAGYLPKTKRGL